MMDAVIRFIANTMILHSGSTPTNFCKKPVFVTPHKEKTQDVNPEYNSRE